MTKPSTWKNEAQKFIKVETEFSENFTPKIAVEKMIQLSRQQISNLFTYSFGENLIQVIKKALKQ